MIHCFHATSRYFIWTVFTLIVCSVSLCVLLDCQILLLFQFLLLFDILNQCDNLIFRHFLFSPSLSAYSSANLPVTRLLGLLSLFFSPLLSPSLPLKNPSLSATTSILSHLLLSLSLPFSCFQIFQICLRILHSLLLHSLSSCMLVLSSFLFLVKRPSACKSYPSLPAPPSILISLCQDSLSQFSTVLPFPSLSSPVYYDGMTSHLPVTSL